MRLGFLAVIAPIAAVAQPQMPVDLDPSDGGWVNDAADLEAHFGAPVPADVFFVEAEVYVPPMTLFATRRSSVRSSTNRYISIPLPALPDAGSYAWRARSFDDAGQSSAFTPFATFRLDTVDPPQPAPLAFAVDGGFVDLIATPVTDDLSGVSYYHFVPGLLDPPGGMHSSSIGWTAQVSASRITVALGPGSWTPQVHVHDRAGNQCAAVPAQLTIAASGLEVPTPRHFGTSTAPAPTSPYLDDETPLFVWSPPASYDAGGYSLVARRADAGSWFFAGQSNNPLEALTLEGDGPYFVRVAAALGGEVSAWSQPAFVWVDTTPPFGTLLQIAVDAGMVTLAWRSGSDRNPATSGSGMSTYTPLRCCAPDGGSVELAVVPHMPDASYSVTDAPGPGTWLYLLASRDRAGNGVASNAWQVTFDDAGLVDAGVVDAGEAFDAGTAADAGTTPVDAGVEPPSSPRVLEVGCGCGHAPPWSLVLLAFVVGRSMSSRRARR